MPTNLYGPKDNYDLLTSHVLPALIRKIHEAKVSGAASVTVWGSGQVRREFLHTTDLAEACLFLMQQYNEAAIINVGCGQDLTIRELAQLLSHIIGFTGELVYDTSRPDGTPRKLMDVSKINQLGWKARIDLESGLRSVYAQYQSAPW
jgi:GDP-L-fucose synthase